jgi:hypothetical protein
MALHHLSPDSSPYSPRQLLPLCRAEVLAEAELLLTARKKCKVLWAAIQVADYKKEGVLNEAATTVLYEKEKGVLRDLLLVANCEEFVDLLDEFEDGFLTEDEQMLMFSLVRERMQRNASALCALHEYDMYRRMMRKVRKLETDIVEFQDVLRIRLNEKELHAYKELGHDKLKKFSDNWHRRLALFEEEKRKKLEDLADRQEMEVRKVAVHAATEARIAKASAKMRSLEVEEKLIAISERYNEAHKIRTEIASLEVTEQAQTHHSLQAEQYRLSKGLSLAHSKERRHMQLKLNSLSNRLLIAQERQAARLQKEIKLHLNDITKQHNLSRAAALKVGKTRDEQQRSKRKAKEMMAIIGESKSIPTSRKASIVTSRSFPVLSRNLGFTGTTVMIGSQSARQSPIALRPYLKNVTRFKIAPVQPNWEGPVHTANGKGKLTKLEAELAAKRSSKSTLQSVSQLYSPDLIPLEVPEDWEEV